tara:strand:- start:6535 stop:7512 length:978 start_codon:yes stop_codon:yes gene_type:complete
LPKSSTTQATVIKSSYVYYTDKLDVMKKLLLLLVLAPLVSFGQFDITSFIGTIQTGDSVVFPYEINISRLGNSISGFSISDRGGNSETKTAFEISRINKEILFKEKDVIYTKADYGSFDDFCLVTFSLKEKEIFKSNKIKVDFKGFFKDETPCINGSLSLVQKNFIEKKFLKAKRKLIKSKVLVRNLGDSIKLINEKINTVKEQLFDSGEIIFTKNDKLKFNVSQPYTIYVKDYSIYDGDKINVIINNKEIKHIIISEEPLYFNIDNIEKENKIKITGISEGEYSPVTASIIIQNLSGKTIQKIKLKLKKGETNEIIINNLMNFN